VKIKYHVAVVIYKAIYIVCRPYHVIRVRPDQRRQPARSFSSTSSWRGGDLFQWRTVFVPGRPITSNHQTAPRRAADRRRQRKSAAELPVTVLTAGKPARCGTYWHLLFGLCNRTVWNLPEGMYTVLVLKMF